MFRTKSSNCYLTTILAGLLIGVTVVAGSLVHATTHVHTYL
jgi:hypothetical protein